MLASFMYKGAVGKGWMEDNEEGLRQEKEEGQRPDEPLQVHVEADGLTTVVGGSRERLVEPAVAEEEIEAPDSATAERLRELKALLDDGLITESEFEAKKAEVLREL